MSLVTILSFVGVYAVNNSAFDILLMTIFGVIGFFFRKVNIPLAPIILGLVLGELMETNLRRAMTYSRGDWGTLFDSPITITLWIMTVIAIFLPMIVRRLLNRRKQMKLEAE